MSEHTCSVKLADILKFGRTKSNERLLFPALKVCGEIMQSSQQILPASGPY